jgi:NhaP-type Na+/H+ or K+/H+ antiporter
MADDPQREQLELLREIRDTLKAQRALVEEQLARSRQTMDESLGLQRTALARQRQITLIAVPGILACILAIGYLIWRYF